MPEQRDQALDLLGLEAASLSGMTVWKLPLVNSDSGEVASLFRSSDLGVMMISGLRRLRTIWRRSTWKIWLAVVGCTTWMLVSALQLHEALEARRAVLRALAFVAVRQHQA